MCLLAVGHRRAANRRPTIANRRRPSASRPVRFASTGASTTRPGRGRRPITDFLQAEPVERAPTTDHMEIRFVYDDTALWIGARMDSSGAHPGADEPSRRWRSGGVPADRARHVSRSPDRVHVRRHRVRRPPRSLPSDRQRDDIDAQFDPVWQARTSVDERGWTAEFWLPFSQLRFNDQPERVWGLNIKRWQPQLNEQDYWVVVGRTERRLGLAIRRSARHRGRRAEEAARSCCRTCRARRE